jgi:hypothetical protein
MKTDVDVCDLNTKTKITRMIATDTQTPTKTQTQTQTLIKTKAMDTFDVR